MSLLKRYVLKKFISSLLLSAIGLIGIFLVVDFFERVDEFVRRDMPYSDLIFYYIYKIPAIAFYMAPQAVLLATVITLATLAQNNEIIAMKSCGTTSPSASCWAGSMSWSSASRPSTSVM